MEKLQSSHQDRHEPCRFVKNTLVSSATRWVSWCEGGKSRS